MGCIDFCNTYIAVEECIELCRIDVKRKTTSEWKKGQQFFMMHQGSTINLDRQ